MEIVEHLGGHYPNGNDTEDMVKCGKGTNKGCTKCPFYYLFLSFGNCVENGYVLELLGVYVLRHRLCPT